MQISHVALWTDDLEKLKDFYVKYFGGKAGQKYVNPQKGFESYFISFDCGAALEIMSCKDVKSVSSKTCLGYCHAAFKTDSREEVIKLTKKLSEDGYKVVSGPRVTGDGYFESVICDPAGNLVEITA